MLLPQFEQLEVLRLVEADFLVDLVSQFLQLVDLFMLYSSFAFNLCGYLVFIQRGK